MLNSFIQPAQTSSPIQRQRQHRCRSMPPIAPTPPGVPHHSVCYIVDASQDRSAAGAAGTSAAMRRSIETTPSNNNNKAVSQRRRRFAPQRFVPHVYLGADYDLDEVWYGATRWIAKCSWGPSSSSSADDESNAGASSLKEVVPTTIPAWKAMADTVCRRLFPSSSNLLSASSWMLDAEGERSVFDGGDTTARLRLIQSSTPSSPIAPSASVMSTSNANDGGQTRLLQITTPAQLSIEYDSAKYYEETTAPYHATTSTTTTNKSNNRSRALLQYAPALTIGIKIPFLHPRIELHSKKTFVVKGGGDANGNYYGGDYFGGGESSADRRLESIKERYQNGVPTCSVRSDSGIMDAAIASSATGSTSSEKSGSGDDNDFVKRLSTWLENDGWMLRRVTADLMGNLISTRARSASSAAIVRL